MKNYAYVYGLAEEVCSSAKKFLKIINIPPKIRGITTLPKEADSIIETALIEAARFILSKMEIYRKDLLMVSVGALIDTPSIFEKAKFNIYVPSGAICGADGLGALNKRNIKKISLITSKPPKGLIGAKYLKDKKIDLTDLKREKIIF